MPNPLPKHKHNLIVTLTREPHYTFKLLGTNGHLGDKMLVPTSIVACQFSVLIRMSKHVHTWQLIYLSTTFQSTPTTVPDPSLQSCTFTPHCFTPIHQTWTAFWEYNSSITHHTSPLPVPLPQLTHLAALNFSITELLEIYIKKISCSDSVFIQAFQESLEGYLSYLFSAYRWILIQLHLLIFTDDTNARLTLDLLSRQK